MTTKACAHKIEVRLRSEFADAEGASALALLQGTGLPAAKDVRTSKVYEIAGVLNSGQVQQLARELLCDPVTQQFELVTSAAAISNGMSHWRVEVWLKPSVTDPVGDTVRRAMSEMGLPEPSSVRVGAVYHIAGRCGRAQLEKAVTRALANPVIHRVSVAEAHP